jgi:hypothetical protein
VPLAWGCKPHFFVRTANPAHNVGRGRVPQSMH